MCFITVVITYAKFSETTKTLLPTSISISLIKQTIGGHMSPNGASQLSIHIGNEVAYGKQLDKWHSSYARIGEGRLLVYAFSILSFSFSQSFLFYLSSSFVFSLWRLKRFNRFGIILSYVFFNRFDHQVHLLIIFVPIGFGSRVLSL
ncbi:hypothetical protein Hanom_Chr17g01570051 [Helianthus anomalus]